MRLSFSWKTHMAHLAMYQFEQQCVNVATCRALLFADLDKPIYAFPANFIDLETGESCSRGCHVNLGFLLAEGLL